MIRARNGIAAVSLALVVLTLALVRDQATPGPLAAVHAREQLGGADGCARCHADAQRDMADACMSCHEPIGNALADGRGMHGGLAPELARDCARCHGEHEGHGFALAGPVAFQRAGYDGPDAYDHAGLDFGLEGAHAALRCERCHAAALADVLPEDSPRFLGLDQVCATCHEDPHRGDYGNGCARCHGQRRPFPEMDGFEHQTFCPLVGAHADVECRTCHPDGSDWSVATLAARHGDDAPPGADDHPRRDGAPPNDDGAPREDDDLPAASARTRRGNERDVDVAPAHDAVATAAEPLSGPSSAGPASGAAPARDCEACHLSPHRQPFVDTVLASFPDLSARRGGQALLASATETAAPADGGTACRLCHGAEQGRFGGDATGQAELWHGATGFALDAPHDALDCVACHAGFDTRAPLAATVVPGDGRPRVLDRTAFLADYPGRDADGCQACHGDPHEAQFEAGPLAGSACLDCHERHAFAPSTFGVEHHADTRWPLHGAHAATECARCHEPVEHADDATDRARRRFADAPSTCRACHASPHRETFLAGLERVDAALARDDGDDSCLSCHDAAHEGGFSGEHGEAPRALHAASGFPLDVPHDALECTACHSGFGQPKRPGDGAAPGAADIAATLATSSAASTAGATSAAGTTAAAALLAPTFLMAFPGRDADACQACHADPHEGQFERGAFAGQGCLACHARHAFVPPDFGDEHHARTDFPLDGAHLAVACGSCHRAPADAARRFVDTPTDCAACHDDVHHGRFDGFDKPRVVDGARGCARCHDTEAFDDFSGGRFDHTLWTGWPVAGEHEALACDACHRPRSRPDADGRRFGRALGTDCAACHGDSHAGQFAQAGVTDCTRCHAEDRPFEQPLFDHQRDSSFTLDATHQKLDCGACHRPAPLPQGGSAVRYRPLGSACADCHSPGSVPDVPPEGPR